MSYQYQTGYDELPVMPPDNKTLAIVALILSILCSCSLPGIGLSIYAIMQANEVETAMNEGFPKKAETASKNAKLFSWIAIGLTAFQFVFLTIYMLLVIIVQNV